MPELQTPSTTEDAPLADDKDKKEVTPPTDAAGLLGDHDRKQAAGGEPGEKGADEGAGGEGPGDDAPPAPHRPEGLPDHLLGTTDVETLDKITKAYVGSREALAKGGGPPPDKPEDYEWKTPPEMGDLVPDGDPAIALFKEACHDAGVGKEMFSPLVARFLEKAIDGGLFPPPQDLKAEAKIMGPNADANLAIISGWRESLLEQKIISAEEASELTIMAGTGHGANVLLTLMAMTGERHIPPTPPGLMEAASTKELATRMQSKKMHQDSGEFDEAFYAETTRQLDAYLKAGGRKEDLTPQTR